MAMTCEDVIAALENENAELRVQVGLLGEENARLRERIGALEEQLGELGQSKRGRPSFVKPNRARREGPKGPRAKRAAEHNTSRKRMEPTRVERHALERCPKCDYGLSGESVVYRRQVVELP